MPDPIASSTAIDLSRLPAPEFDALVESDPAMKILQVSAFRELLLRQRVNEAGRANMIAYAAGGDLDFSNLLNWVRC